MNLTERELFFAFRYWYLNYPFKATDEHFTAS